MGEEKIKEAEGKGDHAGKFMVVNTEWGAMDNQVSLSDLDGQGGDLLSKELILGSGKSCLSLYSITSSTENLSTRELSWPGPFISTLG